MLQSIHAILHNILFSRITFLQGYSTVLDSAYYSAIRITILILQCSCEQIYFQAFLFQKCIAEIFNRQDSTFYLENYSSSIDCSQTTFSLHTPRLQSVYMHPDYLQSTPPRVYNSTNPQEPFFLENMQILQEEARATFCSTEQGFYQKKSLCYRHLMGQFEFYVL